MPACFGRSGHTFADGFEDFGFAALRNQESKEKTGARRRGVADIGSGSGAAFDEPFLTKVANGAADGDARGAELLYEVGLARKLAAGFVFAGQNIVFQDIEDLLVFRADMGSGFDGVTSL